MYLLCKQRSWTGPKISKIWDQSNSLMDQSTQRCINLPSDSFLRGLMDTSLKILEICNYSFVRKLSRNMLDTLNQYHLLATASFCILNVELATSLLKTMIPFATFVRFVIFLTTCIPQKVSKLVEIFLLLTYLKSNIQALTPWFDTL